MFITFIEILFVRPIGHVIERRIFDRSAWGSKPLAAGLKVGQFHSPHFAYIFRKRHWTPYLVTMPGEVKDTT